MGQFAQDLGRIRPLRGVNGVPVLLLVDNWPMCQSGPRLPERPVAAFSRHAVTGMRGCHG
jgi:hypothetical protein